MKKRRARGLEDILIEASKFLGEMGCVWLTRLFNKKLRQKTLDEWGSNAVLPICKNKGGIQLCNSYCGIKFIGLETEGESNGAKTYTRDLKISLVSCQGCRLWKLFFHLDS